VDTVFFADSTASHSAWKHWQWGVRIQADNCYRWAEELTDQAQPMEPEPALRRCTRVWEKIPSSAAINAGLAGGQQAIELLEVSNRMERGRFGRNLLPLMWIRDGRARMVFDPVEPGVPNGDMAVVLRSRFLGLRGLLGHVDVFSEHRQATFEGVTERLLDSARRMNPSLPVGQIKEGIFARARTMPVAIGSAIAVPHAYWDGVEKSVCFLGVVPGGIPDLETPDHLLVTLVFLLLSPTGRATEHLESLAVIATLGQDREFVDLLSRQRVPARVLNLLFERG
jgi:mannitol/fructose-specific phosphotransferase system IIA component (Ntr-type)